ncbi:MAG: hypothetical protein IT256_05975 [Chitinophagaceae bacterium]|nr:hypothetical protein [Chitinophagaceae bacterium]
MKYFSILTVALLLFLGSCCSNNDTCSILSFKNIKMQGFDAEEMRDTLILNTYYGPTGFTQLVNAYEITTGAKDNGDGTFNIETGDLSIDDNYEIEITNTAQKYKLSGFSVEKVACGKCFMRSNNKFGYRLNGYRVSGVGQKYEGQIIINK